MGISSSINKYTEEVLTAAQLRKGAKANAEEEVVEKLNRQSVNIQTHISDLERKYAQNSNSWTNLQFDELKQETDDHRETLDGVKQQGQEKGFLKIG